MKTAIYNKRDAEMNPVAKIVIAEIANKVARELSEKFSVIDIDKISIRDIQGSENMKYVAPEIERPILDENTPLEMQKLVIDAYIFQKNNNGFLYTTMVDIEDLYPALCQRTVDVQRVNEIANHFSIHQFTPVKLVYDSDKKILRIQDGQHHASAAKKLHIPKIPCTIAFGKTQEQIAEDFESQNDYTKKLNQIEKYEAGLLAGYEDCVAMDRVCNMFRIKLAGNSNEYPKTIHSIRAVKRVVRDYGEEGLKFVFQLLIDAGWEKQTKAYEESAINIGYGVLEVIRMNEGDFNYNDFIKEAQSYKNVTDYLVHMTNEIGSYAVNKHPEQTPKIYLTQKYGK